MEVIYMRNPETLFQLCTKVYSEKEMLDGERYLVANGYYRMLAMRRHITPIIFEFYTEDYGYVDVSLLCTIVLDSVCSVADTLLSIRRLIADINAELASEDYRFVEKKLVVNHKVFPLLFRLSMELDDVFVEERVLLRKLLDLCGDIESNPGPVVMTFSERQIVEGIDWLNSPFCPESALRFIPRNRRVKLCTRNDLYADIEFVDTFSFDDVRRFILDLEHYLNCTDYYDHDVGIVMDRYGSALFAGRLPRLIYFHVLKLADICFNGRDIIEALRKLLTTFGNVELNPGPTYSVLYSNYASTHHEFYNLCLEENAKVEETEVMWTVRIVVCCDTALSSNFVTNRNKKQGYEQCFEQIMNKIWKRDADLVVKKMRDLVVPESEAPSEGAHGEVTAEVDTALHTNLAVTTDPSVGVPTSVGVSFLGKTTTEAIGDYSNLTEQWYLIDEFEWDATDTGILREYVLPRDVLTANVPANSPPLIPFNVNYMWSGDLELRVETKAQMFLTGSLQVSSFYELNADLNADLRRNIYTASQTNHVLVNAGGSNEAVLKIPYVNRQPFIQTKLDSLEVANNSVLNMVNVLVQVLNPLRVGTGSASVNVAIFIRFINAKFHGKRDGAIGTIPESLSRMKGDGPTAGQRFVEYVVPESEILVDLGVALAEKAVNRFQKNKNRDNPPAVAPSQMLVPYPAQSWAAGTDTAEPLRTLRIDPAGQTAHDMPLENIDTLTQICQIFGLLRQVTWSEDQLSGTTLFKFPCSPLAGAGEYVNDGGINPFGYYIPPVGVIASLFNLYRGPLKFRLDIVANKFYTGGLIMGYIPGIDITTTITNNMIRNSAFTTYSLDANNLSITYETPYINSAEWYSTSFRKPFSVTNRRLPGVFVVNVLQRLQQPSNVNSSVDINFYMAGGSNFECCNLTQPSLVLRQDAVFDDVPELVFFPTNLTDQIGWSDFGEPYFGVFNNRALAVVTLGPTPRTWTVSQPNLAFIARSSALIEVLPGVFNNQVCMLKVGATFVCAIFDPRPPVPDQLKLALNSYVDTLASRDAVGAFLLDTIIPVFSPLPSFVIIWRPGDPILREIVVPESEREANPNFSTSVQAFNGNGWGSTCFGESFNSVYDLLRRPIYNETFTFSDTTDSRYPNALFKVRVTPVPPVPNLNDRFDVVNRSSHTRILLSGYRYYRGGMRYRIIFPYLPGVFVWVQYDASDKIQTSSILYPSPTVPTPIIRHSNPLDLITLSVNQIMNIEVPFYNPNDLNYLQDISTDIDHDQAIAADMGSFMVGFSTNTNVSIGGDYTLNVYSKIADDFSLSVFQGFTSMQFLTALNDEVIPTRDLVVPEMENNGFMARTLKGALVRPIVNQVKAEIADVTSDIGDAISKILTQVKASAVCNLDFNLNSVLTDVMSQLGHCLINPSLKTLGWAVISMLAKIGILSYNMISKAANLFSSICSMIFPARATNQVPGGEDDIVVIESDENIFVADDFTNHLSAFWGLIITSCASLVSVSFYPSLDIKSIAKNLLPMMRSFSMTANSLTNFFKLHLDMISEIFKHLCFWRSVNEKVPESVEIYNGTFIKSWCEEVSLLTSPGYDQIIMTDTYLMDRVYLAYLLGQIISKSVVDKSNKVNNPILLSYLTKINKLHEDCIATGKTGCVRMETFGVWLHGRPGIGKSYIVESLTTELILAGDINFSGEKILTLNPSDKYWSRCSKQPCVFIDDVFALTTEESKQSQLTAIFAIMTPAPLCPVMADIKQKNQLYSPDIFMMCSNVLFPIIDGVTDRVALWRRRNLLVDVRINPQIEGYYDGIKVSDLKIRNFEGLKEYKHLQFRIAQDPSNPHTRWTNWMDWDNFKENSKRMFQEFRTQAAASYNFRLNEFYRAQKRVMPTYHNILENIPDGQNLYKIAAELAQKLDSSFVKPKDSWCHAVKDIVFEKCNWHLKFENIGNLSEIFFDVYAKAKDSVFKFDWKAIEQPHEGGVPESDTDDPDRVLTVLRKEIKKVSYYAITLDSILTYLCGIRNYIGDQEFLKLILYIKQVIDSHVDFSHSVVSDKTRFERMIGKIFERLKLIVNCVHLKLGETFGYSYNSKTAMYEWEDANEESIQGYCCHADKCILTCRGFVDYIFTYVYVIDEAPPYFNSDILLDDLVYTDLSTLDRPEYYWELMKKYCKLAFDFCCNWKVYVTAGVGLVIFAFVFAWKKYHTVTSEGAKYDANKLAKQSRQVMKKANLKVVRVAQTKQAKDEVVAQSSANVSDLVTKIRNNTVFVRVRFSENGVDRDRKYRCLMIGDRKCIMIRHYIEEIQYYLNHYRSDIVMLCNNGTREVDMPRTSFDEIAILDSVKEDEDDKASPTGVKIFSSICVVEFPKICPQFKNLVKHFITLNEETRIDSDACLVRCEADNVVHQHHVEARTRKKELDIVQTDVTSRVIVDRCWEYSGVHGYGYCGSILIHLKTAKIVGMHTAGGPYSANGFSERLIRDEFDDIEKDMSMDVFVPNLRPIELTDRVLEGSVFPIGKVPQEYARGESGRTRIRPSLIHGEEFEVRTEPAPLSPFDPRLPEGCSPLYDGIAKHGQPSKEFPQWAVDLAVDDFGKLLIAKCKPLRQVGIVSEKEAIFGNPDYNFHSIPMDSSEGFPLSSLRPKGLKGKGWLFKVKRDERTNEVVDYKLHHELRKQMDVKWAMRDRNIKPFTVFTDCCKDETLPKEKCRKKGKTRIFSMSPIDFTIHCRQIFGDFIMAHTKHASKLEHAIGIDPMDSETWTELRNYLTSVGDDIIAGDFSNFGPQAVSQIAHGIYQKIEAWYKHHGATEQHLQHIRIMREELINSVHLCYVFLYMVFCGIVSGSFITANFNSMVHCVYLRIAWLLITGEKNFINYYEHYRPTTYGDDGAGGISKKYRDVFNVQSMRDFFAEYGITYTSVDKDDNIIPYCKLEETSFLKHKWIPHPRKHGYYLAALDPVSIEGQMNWVSDEGDLRENTIRNCENALRQAYGHGPNYYSELYARIQRVLSTKNEHFVAMTWDEAFIEHEKRVNTC